MRELRYSDRTITAKPDYLERRFFYYFSLQLAGWLRHTAVTPDMLSLFSLATGIGGVMLLLPGLPYWHQAGGAVLLLIANVLDAADGQLARAKGSYSPAGWYLDDFFDRIKLVLLFAVFGLHLGHHGAVLCLVGLGSLFAGNFLTEYASRHYLNAVFQKRLPTTDGAGLYAVHAFLSWLINFIRGTCRLGFITVGELYILFALAVLLQRYRAGALLIAAYCVLALAINALHDMIKFACLSRRFNAALQQGEPLYVFGAGAGGRELVAHLGQAGFAVAGVLDNDRALAGQLRSGVPVRHPDELPPDPALIIIGSIHHAAIRRQLLARGIAARDILVA